MKKKPLLLSFFLISLVLFTGCSSSPKKDIMRAADWEKKHPDVYATYLSNEEMESTTYGGSVPIDYLEEYPNLKVLYDGYGFSKDYKRARGHVYGLEDVMNTERPKAGASCLACKTADFIELLNKDGIEVNAMDFDQVVSADMETISCYDCHKNTPGTVEITRDHLTTGLSHFDKEFKPGDMACGQCHVEYYMDPDTKEVILPWHNGFDTDDMLAYYDDIEFHDWEHPTTGTKLLKAQHPEFETFQGSKHSDYGLSCIHCHMPKEENEKGEEFRSHHWTSPLKTVESSCLGCHTNDDEESLIARVETIQGDVTKKTDEVLDIITELIEELSKAVEEGEYSEEVLDQVRDYHRKAQFKWDFVFVENSEGFHNSEKAHKNLDEARELAMKGLELLK